MVNSEIRMHNCFDDLFGLLQWWRNDCEFWNLHMGKIFSNRAVVFDYQDEHFGKRNHCEEVFTIQAWKLPQALLSRRIISVREVSKSYTACVQWSFSLLYDRQKEMPHPRILAQSLTDNPHKGQWYWQLDDTSSEKSRILLEPLFQTDLWSEANAQDFCQTILNWCETREFRIQPKSRHVRFLEPSSIVDLRSYLCGGSENR